VHKLTSWDAAFPDNLESIGTGLAAMTEDQSWVLGEYKGSYADVYPDLEYAPNPTPSGEADPFYGYKSTVLDISVLKGHEASYPATFQFMSYMLKEAGPDTYRALCELISCAPERADLFDDATLAAVPGMSVVTQVLPLQRDPVQPPEELYPVWENVVHQIAIEGKTVEEACAYGQEELQKILDQGLAKNLV
jgi:ABC-type glycerol-3-phosphate transport system substrate-binding protein